LVVQRVPLLARQPAAGVVLALWPAQLLALRAELWWARQQHRVAVHVLAMITMAIVFAFGITPINLYLFNPVSSEAGLM
jgi:hypothetical protein